MSKKIDNVQSGKLFTLSKQTKTLSKAFSIYNYTI